jgi:hypothetical protein
MQQGEWGDTLVLYGYIVKGHVCPFFYVVNIGQERRSIGPNQRVIANGDR